MGELLGGSGVRVRVLDERLLRDPAALAARLESLGRALFAARTRAFLAAHGDGAVREPAAVGWRAEAYVKGRAAIVACGRSRDGRVAVRVEGMRRWRVDVEPGADGAAVQEAAEALLRDQAARIRQLKRTIWQLDGTAGRAGGGRIPAGDPPG
ncbi:hypothetical protein [Dactylosporangium sp. CA-092794]|uniref:hypothetical protein n=1 Tax=Dactylosporangium sp. CA-092794 TaxID=3239929 RepID=UPI003D94EDDF